MSSMAGSDKFLVPQTVMPLVLANSRSIAALRIPDVTISFKLGNLESTDELNRVEEGTGNVQAQTDDRERSQHRRTVLNVAYSRSIELECHLTLVWCRGGLDGGLVATLVDPAMVS